MIRKFRATASSGIRKIFCLVIYTLKKIGVKQNVSKAQEWGGMYQRYENKNLNNIQRFNERVSQDKESLEMHI